MLFPVIKIKECDSVHIVGTNSHDELIIKKQCYSLSEFTEHGWHSISR